MSSHDDATAIQRLAEASGWRVALSEAEVETSPEFEAWLGADPANAAAWDEANTAYGWWSEQATTPEVMAVRSAALQRARRHGGRRYGIHLRGAQIAAALLAAVVLSGAVGGAVWWANQPQVFRTAMGERRTVTLQDGSRLALDASTEVRVRLKPDARRLELVRGQARFDVAHDTARPFTVRARDQLVVATGTSFNVDLLGPKVTVTLLEGRVTILREPPRGLLSFAGPRDAAAPVVARLTAGQQLMVADAVQSFATPASASVAAKVAAVDTEKAVAWESGQIVFDDEPLSSVATRISRYSERPITAEGPAAALKMSGVFNAGDIATFIDVVQRALPVQADMEADGVIRLRARGG